MIFGKKYTGRAGLPADLSAEDLSKVEASAQAGQILLIVILLVAVTVVGLSLMTRNIVSLRIATEEAESQRAQVAAEAGVERVIQASIPIGIDGKLTNNSEYATTVDEIKSPSFLINGGNSIPKDEGADVWFVEHNSDNSLDYSSIVNFKNFLHLYWGLPSEVCGTSNAPAAIQAIVITRNKNTGEIKSYRYAYDSCSRGNNFTLADKGNFTVPGIQGVIFGNRTPESGANNDLAKGVNEIVLIRVIPVYRDSVIGIYACNRAENNCTVLPSQGYVIMSTGISGQAYSKFTVFKGYPQAYLPYLSYGLFVVN